MQFYRSEIFFFTQDYFSRRQRLGSSINFRVSVPGSCRAFTHDSYAWRVLTRNEEKRNVNERVYKSASVIRGANKLGRFWHKIPRLRIFLYFAVSEAERSFTLSLPPPGRRPPLFLALLGRSPLQSVKWQTVPLPSRRSRRGGYNLSGNHPISLPVMRPNRFNQLV